MPVTPEAVQAALQTIKTAYYDECHLAADAVVSRVQDGEITTDEALWDAIVETHQARVSGEPVTPKWSPILLSEYRYDQQLQLTANHESDLLWEMNRVAWIHDICHVLNEHHRMEIEGTTREAFLSGNPLDSISSPSEVALQVAEKLESLAPSIRNLEVRALVKQQAQRLKRKNESLNPSPSASRRRCRE